MSTGSATVTGADAVVVIPTYNESRTIDPLLDALT